MVSLRCTWYCEKPPLCVYSICMVHLSVFPCVQRCITVNNVHVKMLVSTNAPLQRRSAVCFCFHWQPWGKWLMPQPLRHCLRPSYVALQGFPMLSPSSSVCVCVRERVFMKDFPSIYLFVCLPVCLSSNRGHILLHELLMQQSQTVKLHNSQTHIIDKEPTLDENKTKQKNRGPD